MDMQTIKNNMDQGKYKNPWEFCDHMWLIFENAWLYNRKNTKVYFIASLNKIYNES
jgi:E1A/CREB-binding protein